MPHFVYIFKSLKDGKYYIGETANVASGLDYHNSGKQRSTKFRIPFILIYFEEYDNRTLALKREKQIKSWKGGNSFTNLISGM